MTELLFSYGTLQLEAVQLASFGRILTGTKEILKGYKIEQLEITNASVIAKSGKAFHPIAMPSTHPEDYIEGTLYQISLDELQQADAYEVDDYKRVQVTFESKKQGWIYIKN